MKKVININKDWNFKKEDIKEAYEKGFNYNSWKNVSIPHTWNIEDGTSGGNNYYKGSCWYSKEIFIDNDLKDKKVYIEFLGANSVCNVYVNGTYVGNHKGGYSAFRFDITDVIEFDKYNTIVVNVDNALKEDVYPTYADFTFYGGIYRDVNLVVTENIHFDLMNNGSKGVYVYQDDVNDDLAKISIKTDIANDDENDKKCRLWIELYDADNKLVKYTGKDLLLNSNEVVSVNLPLDIENPNLWNATEDPYLYVIKVSLMIENRVIDELDINLGLRYFEFRGQDGFFLNGKYLKLKGISRHQDKEGKGWALDKSDHEYDIELIKEVGANSIRLAHYQHDDYFYELCDKHGLILWAEIPFISLMSKTDLEGTNAKTQLIELIRQNMNHSSIIMWGVQNEIQISGEREEVRRTVQELNDIAHKEDPTRVTTQANASLLDINDPFNYYTDIVAYNEYFGWYKEDIDGFGPFIDEFVKNHPKLGIGISEYGAEGIIQYHTNTPKLKDYSEEYHSLYHEKAIKIFNERTAVWGTYVWNFFDFGSDLRDEGGVKGRNNKGLITFDRKIKKDAFYSYKAVWSKELFVHITSKRYIDRPDDKINIKVYSNCYAVTLVVNNEVIRTIEDKHVFTFEDVILKEGYNDIKAIANDNGKEIVDYAVFNKVEKANPLYKAPKQKGGLVANWFDENLGDKFANVVITELNITDDVFSSACKIGEIMKHPDAWEIIAEYFSEILEKPAAGMLENMTLDEFSTIADFDEKFMFVLNRDLCKIKK